VPAQTILPPPQPAPPPPVTPPPIPVPAASTPAPIRREGPSLAARAAEGARAIGAPMLRWLPRVAAVAALGAAVVYGGPYLWSKLPKRSAPPVVEHRTPAPAAAARPQAPAVKRRPTGGLDVKSTPPGAEVFVDGKPRGVTPLTLADLPVGRHAIELKSDAGTIQRTVTIAAGENVQLEESIFSGWLAVHSPFDVVVSEGNRALVLDDRNQVMLPPGRHQVRVVNRAFAYDAVHQVDLKPGEATNLTITPPPSSLTLTASEPVTVWLDGERLGETPLNAVPVAIGTHDLLVRRAGGGERKFTITVTANPFAMYIDFTRSGG
jgi:PEGA domain-containing protein